MKRNIALLCLVAFSATLASAKIGSQNYMVEDCKFVSLNNSIRLAYQQLSPARVELSAKSRDVKGQDQDIVVLQGFDVKGGSLGLVGYKVSLDDPEDGTCNLKNQKESDITRLSNESIARLNVLSVVKEGEFSESSLPGSKRYWNDCSTGAVNRALAAWSDAKPGAVPVIDISSARKEDENGVRTYTILLKQSNGTLIPSSDFERPSESRSELGTKYTAGLLRVTMTAIKKGESCTYSVPVVD